MINEFFEKIAKFVKDNPGVMKELISLETEFPYLMTDNAEREIIIFDWFIFDRRLKSFDKTPLEHFIDINKDAPPEEKRIYENFRNNIYSLFEVKALKIGKEMVLMDLMTKKEYWIWEKTATQHLQKGQCILTRILPYEDHYILTGMVHAFPKDSTYGLRLGYKRMRENKADMKINPKQIAEIIHEFQTKEKIKDLDLDKVQQRLSEKLEELGFADVAPADIIEKFNENIEPGQVFKEIAEKAVFPEDKDAQELLELLIALWNKFPHKAMGYISPEEKGRDYPRGPQEISLIQELLHHLENEISPDNYSNKDELGKALAEAQERWLNTPNPELNGKTPEELILEERKRMGNPRKEIGLSITAHPITKTTKKEKEAEEFFNKALSLSKEKNYEEAVDCYKRYLEIYPENYVAWGNMGSLYGLLINKKEAYKCLHKALSINPNYKIARENLALLETVDTEYLKKLAKHGLVKWRSSRPHKRKP
jgi:tetratricopeptide (TPR) repeat protein